MQIILAFLLVVTLAGFISATAWSFRQEDEIRELKRKLNDKNGNQNHR